ncbi:RNA polymerase sigma factor [Streptomyces griseofuscus]|uniref:RNA polymerase sigma factor n=1 Tax=Streptomyces griseofuscus TaxID=146922 RepID=UPI0034512E91
MEVNDVGPTAAVGGVSDRELWARAVNGDRDAFGRIFDRHAKTVYNHLFRRTADWIAERLLSNTRRRLRRLVSHDESVGDHADRVAGEVDDARRMSQLHRALARLPRHEREVVELCMWSGLDQQAAATALGVAVGTVKSRLHRARRRLGADLADRPGVATSSTSKNPVTVEEVTR